MKERTQYTMIVVVIILLSLGVIFFQPRATKAPTHNKNTNTTTNTTGTPGRVNSNAATNANVTVAGTARFFTDDLPDAAPYYRFSALIPSAWVGVYHDTDRSIEFFDPRATKAGADRPVTVLAQYYTGKDFSAAPKGVTAKTIAVDGQPARSYTLTVDAATAVRVPAWKVGQTYTRVDVRGQSGATNTYYTFSKGPSVTESIFSTFLTSLDVQDILQPQ